MRFRSPWSCCSYAGCRMCPFCALQASFEDQASDDRFVFPVGHGVQASGLHVRRLRRTGEFDEKVARLHHLSLGVALNVLSKRADYTAVEPERIRSSSPPVWSVALRRVVKGGWTHQPWHLDVWIQLLWSVPRCHGRPSVHRYLFDSQLNVCSIRSCTRGRVHDCYSLDKSWKCVKPGYYEHTGHLFSILVNPCVLGSVLGHVPLDDRRGDRMSGPAQPARLLRFGTFVLGRCCSSC